MGGSISLLDGGCMSSQVDEQQQIQFELEGLKRTLEWTEIQQEQLLDRLDLLRLDNTRLQDRVEELERHPALRLLGLAGLGLEAVDEVLQMGNFVLLLGNAA